MQIRISRLPQDFWRNDVGSSIIEFALLAPILFFMVVGLWDFGRSFSEASRLASAARAGAQSAILSAAHAADTAAVERSVREDAGDASEELAVTVSRECTCPNGKPVSCNGTCGVDQKPIIYAVVTVEKSVPLTFSYPFVANPLEISRDVRMRVQ